MDRYSGMEKGLNATGVRETKRRRRKSKKAYKEVNQEKTQERPVVTDENILYYLQLRDTDFFAEQKHKYLTTPARLPFSSHQYSHYSTRAVSVWQEATVLMHYGQINSE